MFKCVHGSASPYLADELSHPADSQARCRLRSALSHILVVHRTRLTTVGDWSLPVAALHAWNNLPQQVSASPSLQVFKNRLKTHLFSLNVYLILYSACEVTSVIIDTLIVVHIYKIKYSITTLMAHRFAKNISPRFFSISFNNHKLTVHYNFD